MTSIDFLHRQRAGSASRELWLDALVTAVGEIGVLTGAPAPHLDALLGLTRLAVRQVVLSRFVPRRRDPAAPRVVHRSARVALRVTPGQRRRCFGLLR
ncbi:hypothetical protein NCC78_27345, partial [Micromonospora phytophila]|uniref:hypothetical protein n=1 Tax=Micromonospora phytophila TaxID=709888 RepID=UPI00202EC9AF